LELELGLSPATSEQAQKIIENRSVSGDPSGIAAGGLYIAASELEEGVTLKEAVRLSKETIWQRVDDLRN
jgi:transcription initiation factor TFIIIB Brf1 subunit/transcription initiation factor TFIIB